MSDKRPIVSMPDIDFKWFMIFVIMTVGDPDLIDGLTNFLMNVWK